MQSVAAAGLLLWAAVLIADVQKIKRSEQFKETLQPKETTSVTLFGRKLE